MVPLQDHACWTYGLLLATCHTQYVWGLTTYCMLAIYVLNNYFSTVVDAYLRTFMHYNIYNYAAG